MNKIAYKLPKEFISRINTFLPKVSVRILNALTASPLTTFRINRIKIDIARWKMYMKQEHILTQSVSWSKEAFILKNMSQRQLQETSAYQEGLIYLQNLSSMVPVILMKPAPGERILDLCAAPGSKTTQIASITDNKASIVAVEKIRPRFFRLRANVEKQGVTSARLMLGDGNAIARKFPEYFDKVLLDAPCSSEGLFNAHNDRTYSYWSLRKVKEMQYKQKRLISAAWNALQKGGTMVYSTCTFSPEENEEVINWLIKKFPDEVKVEEPQLPFPNYIKGLTNMGEKSFNPDIRKTRRILPTEAMEGFFIAVLRKV